MAKPTITVKAVEQLQPAIRWVENMLTKGLAGGAVVITLGRQTRTLDQNAKMWAMLHDVASQLKLMVNGEMVTGTTDDWKDVFSAALKREQRLARGIDGGVVLLGMSTKKLNKSEFSDLIELIYAYGSEHGVNWSERALAIYEEFKEAQK